MEKIWLKNYPKGVLQEINPERFASLPDLLDEAIHRFHDHIAFINMGSEMTYDEVDRLSADFASFLQQIGMRKGDRIAIQMPNCLQYPVALFGALRAGLVVVNTNPLYTAREMKHQFKDSGAKAIVILSTSAHHLEEILDETDIEHVVVTNLGDMLGFPKSLLINLAVKYIKKMVPPYSLPNAYSFYDALDKGKEKPFQKVDINHEDLAFLQYTGGTTGVAKGAMLTHRNIIANLLQMMEWMKPLLVEGEELVVLALPLYHIYCLTVNSFGLFLFGATNLMITNPRDIPGFIKTLKKYPFTVFTGLNTLFNALMNHPDFMTIDFKPLKISVAGGMALQKTVSENWKAKTKTNVVEGYGLTETSPIASCNPIDGRDKVGTIGLPVSSTDFSLRDDAGNEVAKGQSGEICIKGPQVMKGYWKNDLETKQIMLPDGWLKTGDVGMVDDEGFFRIVDRKKDMILVSGFNVYPNEIEDVIATHPKVLEVAAVGIPDEKSTEAVKIFVVKRDQSLTKEELVEFCRDQFTGYKRPKEIEFRTELPKTPIGKILRRSLRDEPQKGHAV
jgi:long-chain acyl-CoA synthetase